MLRVQRGIQIRAKVIQEDDFNTKVNQVVEALSVGRLVTSHADTITNFRSRSTNCFAEAQQRPPIGSLALPRILQANVVKRKST